MNETGILGYAAIFLPAESGMYFVEFPDLTGCITQGSTLEQAICNAQEALSIYYQEHRGILPPASNLLSIAEKNPDKITQLIVIDTNKFMAKSLKTVKKTLTLPEWLNDLAENHHVNFSQILKNALISHLKDLTSLTPYERRMLNG